MSQAAEEQWKDYGYYTAELTKFAHQMAFGGVAVAWIFKTQTLALPWRVYVALFWILAYFVADVLQYYLGAVLLRAWLRHTERALEKAGKSLDFDFPDRPATIDLPAFWLMHAKLVCLAIGFFYLGVELWSHRP